MPTKIEPHHFFDGLLIYRGDGSERCVVCEWRQYPSWYVGRPGVVTDEGLPERVPVCSDEHAALVVWSR